MECALLLIGVVLVAGGLWRIFGASVKSGAGSAVEERAVGGGGGGGGAGGGGGGGGGAGGGGGGSRNTGNGSAQHGGPATDTADRELERSLGVAALAAGVIAIGYFLSKARRLKNEVDITGKPPAA